MVLRFSLNVSIVFHSIMSVGKAFHLLTVPLVKIFLAISLGRCFSRSTWLLVVEEQSSRGFYIGCLHIYMFLTYPCFSKDGIAIGSLHSPRQLFCVFSRQVRHTSGLEGLLIYLAELLFLCLNWRSIFGLSLFLIWTFTILCICMVSGLHWW